MTPSRDMQDLRSHEYLIREVTRLKDELAAEREQEATAMTQALSCSKCGSKDIRTIYHARGCDKPGCSCNRCSCGSHNRDHAEYLHFDCKHCQFDWTEVTRAS